MAAVAVAFNRDHTGALTSTQTFKGKPGEASVEIILTPHSLISGVIHTHYKGTYETFSLDDLIFIYHLYIQKRIYNVFPFTVIGDTATWEMFHSKADSYEWDMMLYGIQFQLDNKPDIPERLTFTRIVDTFIPKPGGSLPPFIIQ